jgi:hypothetical protein
VDQPAVSCTSSSNAPFTNEYGWAPSSLIATQ